VYFQKMWVSSRKRKVRRTVPVGDVQLLFSFCRIGSGIPSKSMSGLERVVELLLLPVVAEPAVEGEVVPEVDGQARVARRAPEILGVIARPDPYPRNVAEVVRDQNVELLAQEPAADVPAQRGLVAELALQPKILIGLPALVFGPDLEQGLGREVEVDVDEAVVVVEGANRGELHPQGQHHLALEVGPPGVV